jgi:hypothetical protein
LKFAQTKIDNNAYSFSEAMAQQGCNVRDERSPDGEINLRIVVDPYLELFGTIHSLEIVCHQYGPGTAPFVEAHLIAHPNVSLQRWRESPLARKSLWRGVSRGRLKLGLSGEMPLLRTEISLGRTDFGLSNPDAYAYAYKFELRVLAHSYPATTRSLDLMGYSGLREMFYHGRKFMPEDRVLRPDLDGLTPRIRGPDGGLYF